MEPPSDKIPVGLWKRFGERFERLPASDQHLVLAQVELAPDTARSRHLVPGFSDAGHKFMVDFANAMASHFERKAMRRRSLRLAASRRRG